MRNNLANKLREDEASLIFLFKRLSENAMQPIFSSRISIAAVIAFLLLASHASAQTTPTSERPSAPTTTPATPVTNASPTNPASKQAVAPTAPTPKPVSQEYCLDPVFTERMLSKEEAAAKVTLNETQKRQRVIEVNQGQLRLPERAGNSAIATASVLTPTGTSTDFGITTPFSASQLYYAYLVFFEGSGVRAFALKNVRTRSATGDDALVKAQKLSSGNTIATLAIPDLDAALAWKTANLYLFNCANWNPTNVLQATVRASPARYSGILAVVFVVLIYLVAAFVLRSSGPITGPLSFMNPVRFTAGMDGKASLGKLQVLFFSLLVFGLLLYLLLRTGLLTDFSTTVLTLLGIAGFGSTLAKGADIQRTTLTPQNRAFLIRKQWLDPNRPPSANQPTWRDLFTTDGEFDVYRYQSFIFSLAVGGALFIGGVTQLSTFSIPETLLGILGLSQAVYIGGKLVTPTTMVDLNRTLDDLRATEIKFQDAAKIANQGVTPVALTPKLLSAVQPAYDAYKRLASDVRILFQTETQIPVAAAKIEPSF